MRLGPCRCSDSGPASRLVLSALTTRVADWFAMPNELLYERRAISVAQILSPLPRVRGELVPTFDQLYPVLVAPAFRWGFVPDDLCDAHAAQRVDHVVGVHPGLPARAAGDRAAVGSPYAVAVLSVVHAVDRVRVVPAHRGRRLPGLPVGRARDAGLDRGAVAAQRPARPARQSASRFAGRTQFAVLLALLPAAIVAHELGRERGLRRALRVSVESHRLLAAIYGVLAAAGLVLAAAGRLPGVLGVYGATIGGTGASVSERIVPGGIGGSLVEHIATFALGLGILPFVVGVAWLLANLVRPGESRELHAFACIGAITVVALDRSR